jgi:hypothetical protein
MNIFLLDHDINLCAQAHGNKHVVKMITEYNQLLSTACHVFGLATEDMYRKTHVNHPSAVWVRESKANFEYLLELNMALLDEYTHRYGKVHAGSRLIPLFIDVLDKIPEGKGELTSFVAVLPGRVVHNADTVQLYRELYMTEKRNLAEWKNRNQPEWFV